MWYYIDMTLIESTNHIYDVLVKTGKTYLTVKDVISEKSLISEDKNILENIIKAGFEEMESLKIFKRINDSTWILVKPLHQFNQTLEINHDISALLVRELNKFLKAVESEEAMAEVGNLQRKDLVAIFEALAILNGEIQSKRNTTPDE